MKTIIFRASRRLWSGRLPALIFCLSLTAAFFGCGDDGSDNDNHAAPVLLNGIAAGGAAIIGTVNVRGANGNVSYSAIRSDGSFSVDVSALEAPFVVWAEGEVRGKSVTLYSTCHSVSSNVNVTPATDTVMAMAMGDNPADYFQNNPDASAPDQVALDAAVQTITDLMTDIFQTLGLPADFNVMTSQFNADGQGFDLLLDMVSMTNDGETAQIIDEASQNVLFEHNLATGEPMSNAGSEEANVIISAHLNREGQIAMLLRLVQELYAERRPSGEELAAALDNYVSTDFMANGRTAAETYEQWGFDEDDGPEIGMTFSDIAIYREMTTYTNGAISINEHGDNNAGVWVAFNATTTGGEVRRTYLAFVQEVADGPWKWAGDRCPFSEGGEVESVAMKRTNGSGTSIRSGLEFDVNDEGNLALNRGVDYVMIFNSALPAYSQGNQEYDVVVMARPESNPEVTEYEFEFPFYTEVDDQFTENDGLDISDIDNLEFVFVAMDEDDQPLYTWIDILAAPPLTELFLSEHQDAFFPTITSVGGQPAGSSIPGTALTGDVTVSWDNPGETNLFPVSADLGLGDNDDDQWETLYNPSATDPELDDRDWTSADFSYPSRISDPIWGYTAVEYMDALERQFASTLAFAVEQ